MILFKLSSHCHMAKFQIILFWTITTIFKFRSRVWISCFTILKRIINIKKWTKDRLYFLRTMISIPTQKPGFKKLLLHLEWIRLLIQLMQQCILIFLQYEISYRTLFYTVCIALYPHDLSSLECTRIYSWNTKCYWSTRRKLIHTPR